MCCELLVCASCNGRVSDARCSTCRASRAQVHSGTGVNIAPLLAAVAAAIALLLLVLRTAG